MNKKILIGTIVLMVGSFSIGALFNKSEASLSVIKAGVDEKGNPVCVNKSQVYLFKKFMRKTRLFSSIMTPR